MIMTFSPHNDCTLDTESPYASAKSPLAFVQKRHTEPIEGVQESTQSWHTRERTKTMHVALVLCLNVGVDPPDVYRTQPYARLESWIDPLSMPAHKALETVGLSLQKQYERWQPRARYKQSLDPTWEDVKKLCIALRRNAKEDRVLFHYNGHGVPKPTENGEIWVFNREYTQYMPLSIFDLQMWMGTPSIYVYDCSNAGVIVNLFNQFAKQHEEEFEKIASQDPQTSGSIPSFKNCFQLAACAADQVLPTNPDLPADIFSACLTTPIKIAIHWYMMQNSSKLVPKISLEMIDKIPGPINDRRTMLGELNWIFNAITYTIAWTALSKELFQKLFRQDFLVTNLFRNYLLAERIMRSYDCTPVSCPKLPPMFHHPMWKAWDLSLDLCLSQLPAILEGKETYRPSPFFEDQMTAFEVWLVSGSDQRNPPEQLLTLIQVLLSQYHRLRALVLLEEFLDLGSWAVNLAFSVGMYPYMLKLLQSPDSELRDFLVLIWTKILAVEGTFCQMDLVRDDGYKYFLQIIQDVTVQSKFRAMAAFVMSVIVKDYPAGQEAALKKNLVAICLEQMNDNDTQLRLWIVLCLANLWERYDKAKWCGVRDSAHEKLYVHLKDEEPEVRAAAVYAFGTFLNSDSERTEHATNVEQSVATMLMNIVAHDMSALVRMELINALQWVVIINENSFLSIVTQEIEKHWSSRLPDDVRHSMSAVRTLKSRERKINMPNADRHDSTNGSVSGSAQSFDGNLMDGRVNSSERIRQMSSSSPSSSSNNVFVGSASHGSFHFKLWQLLSTLEDDPHPSVAVMAHTVMNYIRDQIYDSVSKEWADKLKNSASFSSLPSSPSNRSYLLTDSPPRSAGSSVDFQRFSPKITHTLPASQTLPTLIPENVANDHHPKRLVSTKFVEWCGKQYIEPKRSKTEQCDPECKEHFERQWRYSRNRVHLREAKDECRRVHLFRLKNEIFSTRCARSPRAILFHPFESHLVAAVNDAFDVYDYHNNTKLSHWRVERKSWNREVAARITALEFVNAQDITMLMAGSEDGCVRLWSNYTNSVPNHDPTLIAAWQALPKNPVTPHRDASSSGNANPIGLRLAWDQQTHTVFVAGDARFICIWDAESELTLVRLMTNADSSVNCLSVDQNDGGNVFSAGFIDGSIRVFDRRLPPHNCKTITYREHTAPIIAAKIRLDSKVLVAGCLNGVTKMYDIRKRSTLMTHRTNGGIGAFDVHREANIFACGGVNLLTSYDLDGNILDSVQNYDWFVPQRVPSVVSHLAFHPNRVILGYSLVESTIIVTSLDAKKRFTSL